MTVIAVLNIVVGGIATLAGLAQLVRERLNGPSVFGTRVSRSPG
jgi:hypothetical protein